MQTNLNYKQPFLSEGFYFDPSGKRYLENPVIETNGLVDIGERKPTNDNYEYRFDTLAMV